MQGELQKMLFFPTFSKDWIITNFQPSGPSTFKKTQKVSSLQEMFLFPTFYKDKSITDIQPSGSLLPGDGEDFQPLGTSSLDLYLIYLTQRVDS